MDLNYPHDPEENQKVYISKIVASMGSVSIPRCDEIKVEMTLKFDKATKNTYVFAAAKDDAPRTNCICEEIGISKST